jgi:hypothetical protein
MVEAPGKNFKFLLLLFGE